MKKQLFLFVIVVHNKWFSLVLESEREACALICCGNKLQGLTIVKMWTSWCFILFETKRSPKTDQLYEEIFLPQNFGVRGALKHIYIMFRSSVDPLCTDIGDRGYICGCGRPSNLLFAWWQMGTFITVMYKMTGLIEIIKYEHIFASLCTNKSTILINAPL